MSTDLVRDTSCINLNPTNARVSFDKCIKVRIVCFTKGSHVAA